MKMCGIYIIKNIINNKVYIGYSKDIHKRFEQHRKELNNNNKKYNPHLQAAWNKYKEENFIFDILEICDYDKLPEREIFWAYTYK
jgi:group I intron endonuclease